MPCRVSHTSSPVPTSALWRDLVNVAAAGKSTRPASGRTWPLAWENGLSACSGPSLCSTRTTGTPAATQPWTSAFCAAR